MSREKQIEEMRRDLIVVRDNNGTINFQKTAEYLYIRGFRKQSEGEWIPHRFDENGRPISWYCSNCRGIGDHSSYCSHCGAKMKGGAK